MTRVSLPRAARRAAAQFGAILLAGATAAAPAAGPLRLAGILAPAAHAAPAPAPAGLADVAVANVGNVARAVGTAISVDVVVDANNVSPEAAAALLTFDAQYLEVPAAVVSNPDQVRVDAATDIVSHASIDNARGRAYFVIGRNGSPWAPGQFVMLRLPLRVKAAIPDTVGSLQIGLVPSGPGNPDGTDVAAAGVSVFSGQAQAGQVQFVALTPTASPSASPSPTASPAATSTAAPTLTPAPTRFPTPLPEQSGAPSPTALAPTPVQSASQPTQAPQLSPTASAAPAATATPLAPGLGRPAVSDVPQSAVPSLPAGAQVAAHPVAPAFEQFYTERQGIRVLGSTLTAPSTENGIAVQYFEKGRLEAHPDEPNPAWRFQYGLLVEELAGTRAGLPVGGDASTFTYAAIYLLSLPELRTAPPGGSGGGAVSLPDGSAFIPFSQNLEAVPGQVVPAIFWSYVNDPALFPGGWLHDVGLPLTAPVEAVVDKGPNRGRRVLIQAFQRTILTYDPLNPPDFRIERANVGTDYARVFPEKFGG